MRLRSYSAIVGLSLLWLATACQAQGATPREDEPVASLVQEDPQSNEDMEPVIEEPVPEEAAVMTGGSEKGVLLVEEPPTPKTAAASKKIVECPKGSMLFEGECTHKDKVGKIVDRRKKKAKAKIYSAAPSASGEAANDLLQSAIVQMEKSEDNLDEMIEQLKEEQAAEKAEKGAQP